MIARGFDGKDYKWSIHKRKSRQSATRPCSKNHLRARALLRELFPRDTILEEVSLPGSKTQTRNSILFADFYIPNRDLIVEVHGRQHYEHVPFFHKTKLDFYKAKARDRDKADWCSINNIKIITLKYSDNDNDWKRAILER